MEMVGVDVVVTVEPSSLPSALEGVLLLVAIELVAELGAMPSPLVPPLLLIPVHFASRVLPVVNGKDGANFNIIPR